MARPIKFSHVLFMTRKYDEMIAWYRDVFEAEIVHGDPAITFLTYDEENHRFGIANLDILRPEPLAGTGQSESGVNHLSYTYANAADLLSVYARLRDRGIMPYWPTHHGVTLSLYYLDPDGNRIELQVDRFDAKGAIAYMQSEAFAQNPIGVDFDPEELLARCKAGAPEDELLALPSGPMAQIPAAHGVT